MFAASVQRYLDCNGIAHETLMVPGPDSKRLATVLTSTGPFVAPCQALQEDTGASCSSSSTAASTTAIDGLSQCVVVCGGDGTLSSVVNVLAQLPPDSADANRTLVLLPAGTQNAVCHSIGISTVERCIASLASAGRQIQTTGCPPQRCNVARVPVWEVRVDGGVVRYVVGTVAIGTFARIVRQEKNLRAIGEEVVGLPAIKHKFRAAVFLETMLYRSDDRSILRSLFPWSRGGAPTKLGAAAANMKLYATDGTDIPLPPGAESPLLQTIVASSLSFQRRGYSLTQPSTDETIDHVASSPLSVSERSAASLGGLTVTWACGSAATRLRLLHLFWREGWERRVLQEDGVFQVTNVGEMSFEVPPGSTLLLDGETVPVSHRQRIASEGDHITGGNSERSEERLNGLVKVSVKLLQPQRYVRVLVP